MKSLCLAFVVVGCGTDPAPDSSTLPTHIVHDMMLSGDVELAGFVTIEQGATVDVAAGTTIHVHEGGSLDVVGALHIAGTKGNAVTLATPPGKFWLGVGVEGTLEAHYLTQTGGGMYTNGDAASITVTDSTLSDAIGDFLVTDGGTVDIEYTILGNETGTHSHCNIHVNSIGSITFTHDTDAGAPYGLMLYAGTGDFEYDNWIGNHTDIEPDPAGQGNFDGGYFAAGLPRGVPGSTFADPSPTRRTDAGPR